MSSPIKKQIIGGIACGVLLATLFIFYQAYAVSPFDYGLREGDLISASGSDDPDIYIVNEYGYKRLFLNPIIFGFYGHLKWSNVRTASPTTRDAFTTSGLFRNCEQNDPKVYGVEVTAEDGGTLHWVNVSGDAAIAEDPNFFKKIFCINNNEFDWYSKSISDYTAVSQLSTYSRVSMPQGPVSKIPPCVPDKKDYFSISPIDPSSLEVIEPLGHLNPPGHNFPTDHIYFYSKKFWDFNNRDEYSETETLVAPGDMWITKIRAVSKKDLDTSDYAIHFQSCADISGILGHVNSISPKLAKAFAEGVIAAPIDYTEYVIDGRTYVDQTKGINELALKAGETIGTALRSGALDFFTIDRRIAPLHFANPSRFPDFTKYVVCPIDYFTSDTKSLLQSLLGYKSTIKRTIEPLCGEFAQDIDGTAQGVWFVKGTIDTYPENPHLALVHDNTIPTYGILSIGTSLERSKLYHFVPAHSGQSNREFSEVASDGTIYCYDGVDGRPYNNPNGSGEYALIIQLTSPTTLRAQNIGTSCGSGPWSFGGNYADYER